MVSTAKIIELIKNGALLIDLRSEEEFDKEQLPGSLNIPFDKLKSKLLKSNFVKFRKNETVITCSNKTGESAEAKKTLESQGMLSVYDGGAWKDLQEILNDSNKQ